MFTTTYVDDYLADFDFDREFPGLSWAPPPPPPEEAEPVYTGRVVGLYRYQDAVGVGPYNADPAVHGTFPDRIAARHGGDPAHPGPGADFDPGLTGRPGWIFGGSGWAHLDRLCAHPVFAFASLRQLQDWFSADERRELRENGFEIVRIFAHEDGVLFGGRQAAFDPRAVVRGPAPDEETLIRSMEWR